MIEQACVEKILQAAKIEEVRLLRFLPQKTFSSVSVAERAARPCIS